MDRISPQAPPTWGGGTYRGHRWSKPKTVSNSPYPNTRRIPWYGLRTLQSSGTQNFSSPREDAKILAVGCSTLSSTPCSSSSSWWQRNLAGDVCPPPVLEAEEPRRRGAPPKLSPSPQQRRRPDGSAAFTNGSRGPHDRRLHVAGREVHHVRRRARPVGAPRRDPAWLRRPRHVGGSPRFHA